MFIVAYFVLPPIGVLAIESPVDRLGLIIFGGMGIFMSVIAGLYRINKDKAAAYYRELALSESRARLATFAEATFEGIVESEAGRIVDCNEQLARMLGYSVNELRGMEISDMIAPEDKERALKNIRQDTDSVIEHTALRKDGTRIVVEARGRPISPGSTKRLTAIRDITLRKQADESLRQNEERLRLALAAARMATWDWHVPSGNVIWNEMHYRMMGYAPGEVKPTYQAWASRVHPDDADAAQSLIQECMAKGRVYTSEFRTLWPDGTIRYLEARGEFEYDKNNHPLRCYGAMLDITDRKKAEQDVLKLSEYMAARTWNLNP